MIISTHAPAGGATKIVIVYGRGKSFLLTPLREGRRRCVEALAQRKYFYSRPCGRGDVCHTVASLSIIINFYSRPCGRGDSNFPQVRHEVLRQIAER